MIIPTIDENRQKGNGEVIKVLVGLQPKREYLKGALKIAHFWKSWQRNIQVR